ncbi:MAG TPA: HAD-IA family hydrolase [Solirubrobacteraceae bacterium]
MRAVLLDALGTLLELEPPAPRLVAELRTRGAEVDEEEAWAALREEIGFYREHHDLGADRAGLDELRARCTEVLRGALPERARSVADLQGALLASLRFRPYPEVPGALEGWSRAGLRLVVVSNWDVSLHDALVDTGLASLVDGAISSAEVGARKPDPRIFERALALAGVAAEDAIHVGDSLEYDVAGARAAGIEPVLVVRDGSAAPEGVRTVGSLSSLTVQ